MKYSKIIMFILIALLFVQNFVLLNKVSNLENKINVLQNEDQRTISAINAIPSQINHFLNEIKRVESWMTPVRIDVDNITSNNAKVKATWQIKDYDKNAVVTFNYKQNEGEFKEIEVVDKGNGYFETTLSFNVELEPRWIIHVQDQEREASKVREEVKEVVKPDVDQYITYYVAVKTQDNIKSSEMANFHLGALKYGLYGTFIVDVFANLSDRIDVHINHEEYNDAQNNTKLRLKKYNNEQVVFTTNIEAEEEQPGGFRTYFVQLQDNEEAFNRLVLEVTYPNGKVFEQEIYRK